MNKEVYNAKISSTMLGVEDHGIFTSSIYLEWDGGGIGFGGYSLGSHTTDYIQEILEVVGVETWEELKGKFVRVELNGVGIAPKVRLGNLMKDKWFDQKEFFKQYE